MLVWSTEYLNLTRAKTHQNNVWTRRPYTSFLSILRRKNFRSPNSTRILWFLAEVLLLRHSILSLQRYFHMSRKESIYWIWDGSILFLLTLKTTTVNQRWTRQIDYNNELKILLEHNFILQISVQIFSPITRPIC